MLERPGTFVRSFQLAAEYHCDPAFGIELDDHVGSLVGHPDVVFLVDLHGMRIRPGVEIVADFAQELAVRVELQQLRAAAP